MTDRFEAFGCKTRVSSQREAHFDTATNQGGGGEFIPVSVTAGFVNGVEVAKPALGPELVGAFEAALALAAG